MPEAPEYLMDGVLIQYFIQNEPPESRRLINLHLDLTTKERDRGLGGFYPLRLSREMGIQRGTSSASGRKLVYPEQVASSTIGSEELTLCDAIASTRGLTLEWKRPDQSTLYTRFHFIAHNNVNFIRKEAFFDRMCKVKVTSRGQKISIAFELTKWVLVVISQDLIYQIHWANTIAELPNDPSGPSILYDYPGFLVTTAETLGSREKKVVARTSNFATTILRLGGEGGMKCFSGLGKYTSQETSAAAGIGADLTESEVFFNASRMARYVAAYRALMLKMAFEGVELMKRFLVDKYTLASTQKDREAYLGLLKVHGKPKMVCTRREKALVNEYNNAMRNFGAAEDGTNVPHHAIPGANGFPYDPFEPKYIESALRDEDVSLGPLIFGAECWEEMQRHDPSLPAAKPNPLTKYYDKMAVKYPACKEVSINVEAYRNDMGRFDLFPKRPSGSKGAESWVSTHSTRQSLTATWSALLSVPSFILPRRIPHISSLSRQKRSFVYHSTKDEKDRLLHSFVTQLTSNWTIGFLDFAGTLRLVEKPNHNPSLSGAREKCVMMICDKDPGVADVYHRLIGMSLARKIEIRGMFTVQAVKDAMAKRKEWRALYPTLPVSQAKIRLDERERDKEKERLTKEGLGAELSPVKKKRRRNDIERVLNQ